jgi:hypothetical protein
MTSSFIDLYDPMGPCRATAGLRRPYEVKHLTSYSPGLNIQ